MKTHKDVEAPYKCDVDGCSKSYFTPNSLTSHMRSHHKEEELRCQWTGCGKKFDKPCRLKTHMRVHTGQRPFACTYEVGGE
ncbi:Zinc finger protein ZXDC [Portunus trituberculatus]|uniref:Zinc finger protein ZXDC n=1 Tax=Portunus trituberculatus TaxID=210409 RepID=A0A5B7IBN2_PORTR|nr:Zinc finger protein ZXDC [Portunus trituberculatus]